MKKRKSIKTTVFGLLTAAGATLMALVQKYPETLPSWLGVVGAGLSVFGPLGLGAVARDHNVSSEDAGLK